jgi:hypothetical protein
VGETQSGEVLDFSRLEGEGEILDLSNLSDENGLLQPGQPLNGSPEDLIASGAFDYLSHLDPGVIDAILAPYRILWTNRDVVSRYFTPGH